MTAQFQKTHPSDLLDEQGHIIEPGYATSQLWKYDRNKIKAGWARIKEWDYYYILDHSQKYGITFTLSDLGYLGLMAVCWLDFEKGTFDQTDVMIFFPRGKTGFPPNSSEGTVSFKNKKISMEFSTTLPERRLKVSVPKFKMGNEVLPLDCDLTLTQDPSMDTMVIATSWRENRKAFYYNQKVNCMPASGTVTIGNQEFKFNPSSSMAGLDWGRGYWTYKNRWYWGSASGWVNGKPFGWNLGYGFSDRTVASENMLFYDGKAHKLEDVVFTFDPQDYMKPWRITSNDGRCEMQFEPVVDRTANTNLLLIKSVAHQVFGYFTGVVTLDDGTKLHLDHFLGFAEDVLNWW